MSVSRPGDISGSWLPPGTRLNDLYEIEEAIAAGGMGEIYRGHAIQTGDVVAIKTIRSDIANSDDALTMFRKEASALHNLYHEAIIRYYVFSIDPVLKRPYLAMEFVSGPSLADMIKDGALDYDTVRVLGVRVASGLQAAHQRGIIHRDISPDNIIIPDADVALAKIIDFGIARQTRASHGTVIGDGFAGRYNYASPEQFGLFGGDVGAASDIYSFGLVLVEAIAGRPLDMRGSPVELIEKRRAVPDLGHVDKRLRPLIERMLQPDPRERPGSMTEVAAWLRRGGTKPPTLHPVAQGEDATVVSGAPVVREPLPPRNATRSEPASARRSGAGLAVAGLAVLALLAGGGGAYWFLMVRPAADGAALPPAPAVVTRPAAPTPAPVAVAPAAAPPRAAQQARLPDVPAADLASYMGRYSAIPCFFLNPIVIADNRAVAEGFGRSAADIDRLDADFRAAHGFEPDARLRQVTPAQCPVVDLLQKTQADIEARPSLEILSPEIRRPEFILGEAAAPPGSYVSVVIVGGDGMVRVVKGAARPEGGSLAFEIAGSDPLAGSGKPAIIAALASPEPMTGLGQDVSLPADAFVDRLLEETRRTGTRLASNARYVVVKP